MGLILVKKLFEVRFLHEFYLSKVDGVSYFQLPEGEQQTLLKDRLFFGQYRLLSDLEVSPTPECIKKLKANKLFFGRTALGFIIGIEVDALRVDDGAGGIKQVFRPVRAPESALSLEFAISNKNAYFGTITNGRFRNATQAVYFFSNRDENDVKTPPALSMPPPVFQPGRTYEMGELALVGGVLKEALRTTSQDSPADWADVGSDGLASEADRMLLPKTFTYSFGPSGPTSAEFILKSLDGEEVKKLEFSSDAPMQNVRLDFRNRNSAGSGPGEEIPHGFYQLEASGSNSFQELKTVYLNDGLYRQTNWGAVEVTLQPGRSEYELLTPDGNLIIEKKSDGSFDPLHPRFEVRIPARKTIWRYKSRLGRTLKKDVKNITVLSESGGFLVAQSPRPLSASPIVFKALDQMNQEQEVFLPMPELNALREEGGVYYSDIFISKVKDIVKVE
ncbi:MAG: hypothetical protein H6558_12275 [Lewinellaceae bacterium]|nr:hypothetical protein [Phaeodactylibacter sp.]MCB9265794.1 hypothetical protein [Lewinellaceae bacterium]MCB9352562.1 hypothetical protein [Lewinellaceae bacterium]